MTISPMAKPSEQAEEIRVRGTVQGVGFRPTVYRLARACHLRGEVCNDGEGVLIRVAGAPVDLEAFVQRLQRECPPLARIEAIARTPLSTPLPHTDTPSTPASPPMRPPVPNVRPKPSIP